MEEEWLIVGLGNPGSKYKMNRHNMGFMVVDKLWNLIEKTTLSKKKGERAEIGLSRFAGVKIRVVKPQTFMNDSGYSVAVIAKNYQIPANRILIVYDDISLDFGRLRFRSKGSAGGHNGIKSVIKSLDGIKEILELGIENGENFPRLKIGIGPKPEYGDLIDFVLNDFTEEEQKKLPEIIEKAIQSISTIITSTSELAMSEINNVKVE